MTVPNIQLRKTIPEDIETFFTFQLDEETNYLAAFTPENPHDKEAYMTKWARNLANNGISMYTIMYDGKIAGSVLTWPLEGEEQLTYWLGKDFRGKGIGTEATEQFLAIFPKRPVYGRTAFDNFPSQRVLVKCGFRPYATEKHYSNARKAEIEELVFILEN